MQFKASDIAQIIGGKVIGNEAQTVSKFSKIEEADGDSITFLANPKYAHFIADSKAGIVLVGEDFSMEVPQNVTLIVVANPYESVAKLLHFYESKQKKSEIEQPSFVHATATLGEGVYVGAFSYLAENVSIGNNVQIYPNVYIGNNVSIADGTTIYSGVHIYKDCQIGAHCIVHSGAVIGSDGFGFAPNDRGEFQKIPQVGNVRIEDFVEIGANTVIDRATMGSTAIGRGTKLDNLIQIAHNVSIGQNTVVAAQVGISGSTKIGNGVMIGGQAGIVGHISIADGSKINAQSGVSKSLTEKGSAVTGSPAWDYSKMLKAQALLKKLPELFERLTQLEKNNIS